MSSDLSIFAVRLRDFIGIASDDPLYLEPSDDPALKSHLEIEFNGMAIVLFGLQFDRNPAYRKLCEARKITPDSITHWTQIPAVPTVAFKELELTCLAPEQRTGVFHSSGTTEQRPSRHFHSAESLEVYEASLWPWFQRHVSSKFQVPGSRFQLAFLTPPPEQAPHSSLVYMFETIRRKLNLPDAAFLGSSNDSGITPLNQQQRSGQPFGESISIAAEWALDFSATISALREAMESHRPLVLLGTAFSFVHLLDHLAEQKLQFDLPDGSLVMETGGYKGRSRTLSKIELHELISNRLGVPRSSIVCEYGMSEISSQAYDTGEIRNSKFEIRTFRFPPWTRARVVSPETGLEVSDGETGLIQIFDLANVFSVMAVQTEDLAVRRGDAFELIGRDQAAEPRGCSLMNVEPSNP
jgi:hypothetical protein